MPSEHLTALPIKQLPKVIANNKLIPAHFRSKLYIAPYLTNLITAASDPIFSILERICASTELPPINFMHKNLTHELCAFHSKLHASNYHPESTALAYYLLTTTVDEILGKNYIRFYGTTTEFKAFTPVIQGKDQPQKRFFEIVHQIKETPNQFLDLIELAYYCLIAGFEGEQHSQPTGKQYLDNLTEELYCIIQKHRVYKAYRLHHVPTPYLKPTKKQSNQISIIILLTIFITVSIYGLSYLFLKKKSIELTNFQNKITWITNGPYHKTTA